MMLWGQKVDKYYGTFWVKTKVANLHPSTHLHLLCAQTLLVNTRQSREYTGYTIIILTSARCADLNL